MFVRQDLYASRVRSLYDDAVTQLLALVNQIPDLSSDKKFYFADNPRVGKEATRIIRELYTKVYIEVKNDCTAEWQLANLSCDKMIQSAFGWKLKDRNVLAKWWDRNQSALDQFFARKAQYGGLNLSQKVWKYTGDLRTEMENAITVSLGEADTAQEMSRKVRQYLQYPDKLFRRVRGADGKLHLSANAKAFHPSRGVYRSSYKNAMRLARTETNAAYRAADEDRWQRMDFVVGFEVKKSNNHPEPDICDDLAGKYPKDFKFTAWHPQCRCYVVPILAQPDELLKMQQAVLAGKNPSTILVEKPDYDGLDKINTWIKNNHDRILRASAKPYWIVDNFKYGNVDKGLKFDVHTKTPAEAAKLRHQNRDAKKISDAWHEHKMQEIQTRISDADIEVNEAMQGRINALKSAFTSGDNAAIQAAFKKAISGIETQAKWDKIVWEGFTPEQKKNLREFGNTIGVKKGRRMTHEQADSGKVNPLYQPHYLVDPKGHYVDKNHVHYSLNPKYEKGYTINCQTCAPVYTLRRWGFNIEAKPNNKSDAFKYMARHSHEFWTNTDGSVLGGKGVHATTKKTEMFNWLDQQPDGTYQIACTWKGAKSGHTFSYVKEGGVGHFYDPQSNRLFKDLNDFREYSDSVSPKYGWRFWKVENRGVNIPRVKDLIETTIHPTLTREERIKQIAEQRHAKRDAKKLQEAWTQRRLESARKQIVDITKEVNKKFDPSELKDLHVRVRSVYNAIKQGESPAKINALVDRVQSGVETKQKYEVFKANNQKIVQKAQDLIKQANKFDEMKNDLAYLNSLLDKGRLKEIDNISDLFEEKIQLHKTAVKNAKNTLAVVKQDVYAPFVQDVDKLEKLIDSGSVQDLEYYTQKAITDAKFAKSYINSKYGDLLDNPFNIAKKYGLEEVKTIHSSVESNLQKWSLKSLAEQKKKIEFEIKYVEHPEQFKAGAKQHSTWKIAQDAYAKQLQKVENQIQLQPYMQDIAKIKDFYSTHKKYTSFKGIINDLDAELAKDHPDFQKISELKAKGTAKINEIHKKDASSLIQNSDDMKVTFDESAFTQERRDAAKWFLNDKDANDFFFNQDFTDWWQGLTAAEKQAVYNYTAGSSYLTETLRAIPNHYYYYLSELKKVERDIPNMTNALHRSVMKHDMWVKRDTQKWDFDYVFGINLDDFKADPSKLVGKIGVDNSFISTGDNKSTYFKRDGFIYNIYCPKGTKACYAEPFSRFGQHKLNQTGTMKPTVTNENEIILQRGCKYRITKAEYKNGEWFIDVDLLEQNPLPYTLKTEGGIHAEY